nr:immunoglobulin heavy chain junction region [Mus musculus]MBK4197631.1 immunoglobulin heavy chain junction region [Mus musculus]
CARNLGYFDYW